MQFMTIENSLDEISEILETLHARGWTLRACHMITPTDGSAVVVYGILSKPRVEANGVTERRTG